MGVNEIARIIKQFFDGGSVLLLGGKTSHKIRHEGAHFRRNLISSLPGKPPHQVSACKGVTSCTQVDEALQVAGYKDIHGR